MGKIKIVKVLYFRQNKHMYNAKKKTATEASPIVTRSVISTCVASCHPIINTTLTFVSVACSVDWYRTTAAKCERAAPETD